MTDLLPFNFHRQTLSIADERRARHRCAVKVGLIRRVLLSL
jgi:hypothetical protein